MTKPHAIELPLYDFFDALRKNGFSMGIAEYYGLLDALHLGYGINTSNGAWNQAELLEVCRLLWLKPNQSKYLFESTFNEFFQVNPTKEEIKNNQTGEDNKLIDTSKEQPNLDENKTEDTPKNEPQEQLPQNQEQDFPYVNFVIVSPEGDPINLE